jgi:uncharacterized protein (DUF1800 family)
MLSYLKTPVALLALMLVLSACIDGGGSPTAPALPEEDLRSVKQLSQEDRIFFLNRTHFAFRTSELQRLNNLGYENYIDWMLSLDPDPALRAQAIAATGMDTDFPSYNDLARYWAYLMTHNENAFQERLALFWHDHFATSSDVLNAQSRWWFLDHIDMWRHHGTGNLRELLLRMSTDWTMLVWLDGYVSTVNAPNENFAREFWELFTLGADNGYTEADIVEASRSFTGYRRVTVPNRAGPGLDQQVMVWQSNRHDNTPKTIFGQTVSGNGQDEYMDIINLTLNHRQVAEFIVTKVWEEFVYADPSPQLVADLAAGLRASNYDLKALFKRIFMSRAFFSERARESMVKSPIEHHIGFMRATGLKLTPARIDTALRNTGQRPTQPPTVNGWPGGEFWLSSQALVERTNFLRECIFRSSEGPQVGYDVGSALVPPNLSQDHEVVDRLAFLLQVRLTPDQRDLCIYYLNRDKNNNGEFDDPWDYNDAGQRNKKIRGLLYILGQHPSYHIR